MAHTNERFVDFRSMPIPYNMIPGPELTSDRTVLSMDTCSEWDSLLQLGTGTSASGIKSIALGCRTSATGYNLSPNSDDDGGYTFAQGVETYAGGFASISLGMHSSAIGNLNLAYGYKSKSIDVNSPIFNEASQYSDDGFNVSIGYKTSAISNSNPYVGTYSVAGTSLLYGYNFAYGKENISNGGSSYTQGYLNNATGLLSKAIGASNLASGPFSTADGGNLS